MTARILGILLALSVVFNVFFLVGRSDPTGTSENMPRRLLRVANELGLDGDQTGRLGELRTSFEEQTADIGHRLRDTREAISVELDAESPDIDRVRDLMMMESSLIAKRRETATDHFGEFVDLLTAQQRRDLGKRLRPRGNQRPDAHPAHVLDRLDRFDTDEDGQLDTEELEALDAHHREMRQERARRRAELRTRFDTDGDGELNAQEREALRLWVVEHGFNGGMDQHPDGDATHPRRRPRGDEHGPRRGPRGPRRGPDDRGGPPPPGTPPPGDSPPGEPSSGDDAPPSS